MGPKKKAGSCQLIDRPRRRGQRREGGIPGKQSAVHGVQNRMGAITGRSVQNIRGRA